MCVEYKLSSDSRKAKSSSGLKSDLQHWQDGTFTFIVPKTSKQPFFVASLVLIINLPEPGKKSLPIYKQKIQLKTLVQ